MPFRGPPSSLHVPSRGKPSGRYNCRNICELRGPSRIVKCWQQLFKLVQRQETCNPESNPESRWMMMLWDHGAFNSSCLLEMCARMWECRRCARESNYITDKRA